jgi:hypothetical protein
MERTFPTVEAAEQYIRSLGLEPRDGEIFLKGQKLRNSHYGHCTTQGAFTRIYREDVRGKWLPEVSNG